MGAWLGGPQGGREQQGWAGESKLKGAQGRAPRADLDFPEGAIPGADPQAGMWPRMWLQSGVHCDL